MELIRKIILIVLLSVLPFSANGITVVRHFCCGIVEKTEIVLVATDEIKADDHHENGVHGCCVETDSESCCIGDSSDDLPCGDQLVVVKGTDDAPPVLTKSFTQISLHEYYCILLDILERRYVHPSQTDSFEKPEILTAKEYCPSIQVLRL